MKKSNIATLIVFLLLIPLTLFLGTKLSGRGYYITGTLIIVELMIPFFMAFEGRKPQARELVLVAVMCALAIAGRVVIPMPHFKAVFPIILLSGIAFGPETGFMVGAISAFASNFFYAQGPWTPWQMLAYGMGGFLAGVLFCEKASGKKKLELLWQTLFGFFAVALIVGPLLDACTLFTTGGKLSWGYAAAVMLAGLPHNLIHGASTAVTVLLLSRPLLAKLSRLKIKYGMMES